MTNLWNVRVLSAEPAPDDEKKTVITLRLVRVYPDVALPKTLGFFHMCLGELSAWMFDDRHYGQEEKPRTQGQDEIDFSERVSSVTVLAVCGSDTPATVNDQKCWVARTALSNDHCYNLQAIYAITVDLTGIEQYFLPLTEGSDSIMGITSYDKTPIVAPLVDYSTATTIVASPREASQLFLIPQVVDAQRFTALRQQALQTAAESLRLLADPEFVLTGEALLAQHMMRIDETMVADGKTWCSFTCDNEAYLRWAVALHAIDLVENEILDQAETLMDNGTAIERLKFFPAAFQTFEDALAVCLRYGVGNYEGNAWNRVRLAWVNEFNEPANLTTDAHVAKAIEVMEEAWL